MVSEVGELVVPQRPNLEEISQVERVQSLDAPQSVGPAKKDAPFWQRALGKVMGNKARSVVAAAAITAGAGGVAHVSTEGVSTEKALDIAGHVIKPPTLDTRLGIKTDPDGDSSGGNSVDAVKNVFGDGGRMVANGVADATGRAVNEVRDVGSEVGSTVKDALLSEEIQEGWRERSLMGQPVDGEKMIEAELVPVVGSDGKEMPLFVRTKPSQGGERKELKDLNIDPRRVEGVVVYGDYVGGKSAVDGLEVSTWLKIKATEDGEPVDVYVSGLTYKPLSEKSEQSR